MPSGKYYRSQAKLFAWLAIVTSDPRIAEWYNRMALEQLAKAEEADPGAGKQHPHDAHREDGSDSKRD